MNTVDQITAHIGHMNADELAQVIEAVKLRRTWLSRQTMRQIVVGDTVEFDAGRNRGMQRGRVTKVNRTTLAVLVGGYTTWRVPASLVRKVDNTTA